MKPKFIVWLIVFLFFAVFTLAHVKDDNVLYWSLDDNNMSGNVVFNYSGQVYNGTRANGVISHDVAIINQSMIFGGGSEGNIHLSNTNFNGWSGITINMWVNVSESGSREFLGWTDGSHFAHFASFSYRPYFRIITSDDGECGSVYANIVNFTRYQWYMVTMTYDGTTLKGYINGVHAPNVDTSCTGTLVDNGYAEVGRNCHSGGAGGCGSNGFEGTLDEIAIWDRALNNSDILLLYNGSVYNGSGYNPLAPIPGWYPLPEITNYNVFLATNNATAWNNDKNYTVEVIDPTPSVQVTTDINSNCSIGKNDWNYTKMISEDADTGCIATGGTTHTCVLPESQRLTSGQENISIACIRLDGNNESINSTSGALKIQVDSITNNSFFRLEYNITEYFNATSNFLNDSEINITPNQTSQMTVCLNDGNRNINSSCKTFLSGNWGNESMITHTQVPKGYLNETIKYRLEWNFTRIYNGSFLEWTNQTYTSYVQFNGSENNTVNGTTTSEIFSAGNLTWVNAPSIYPGTESHKENILENNETQYNLSLKYFDADVLYANVTLNLNGTNYTVLNYSTSGTTRTYYINVSAPRVENTINVSSIWIWSVTDIEGTKNSSLNFSQNVLAYSINNCSLAGTEILHFYFFEDIGFTSTGNDYLNLTFEFWSPDNASYTKNVSIDTTFQNNYSFCAPFEINSTYTFSHNNISLGQSGTFTRTEIPFNFTNVRHENITYDIGNVSFVNNNTNVAETEYTTVTLNITEYNITNINFINLTYNGSIATTTINTNGSMYYATKQISAIQVNVATNVSYTFDYSFNVSGLGTITGSTSGQHQIFNLSLYNCSIGNKSITFNIFDLQTGAQLTSSLSTTYRVYKDNKSFPVEIPVKVDGRNNFSFCRTPLFTNFFSDSVSIAINSTSIYNPTTYYLYEFNWSNVTSSVNVYLTLANLTSNIQLKVLDELDRPLETFIRIQAYDPGTNTYKLVSMVQTDPINGVAIAKLIPYDQDYRFIVQRGLETLKSFGPMRVWQTEYILRVLTTDYPLDYFTSAQGVQSNLVFNDDESRFEFVFNVPTGETKNISLDVERLSSYGEINVCNETLVSTSGTLYCSVPNDYNDTYIATAFITNSPTIPLGLLSISGEGITFGKTGVFLSVFFIGTVSLVGVFSPPVAVIYTLLAIGASVILKLIPLTITGFMTLVILGGIIILKIKK